MSWNVCWEALTGTKSKKLDKTHCINNNENICKLNIKKIIEEKIDISYDFIFLQEITENLWKSLDIKTDLYNIIYNDIKPSGVITLVKKIYNIKKIINDNLLKSRKDIRPFSIIILSNNIILVNVHFPHKYESQIKSIDTLKKNLLINKKTKILMCGDFNNNDPTKLPNFTFKFNIIDKQINTCCIKNNNNDYKLSYDHIYSNFKFMKYKTLSDRKILLYNNLISDHLPIFSYGIL